MKKLLVVIGTFIFLFSCEKQIDDNQIQPNEPSNSYMDQLIDMGFSKENIVEYETYFVIEEDMVIRKESLQLFSSDNLKSASQRRGGSILTNSDVQNIRLVIDPSISGWRGIIEEAIEAWNEVHSSVNFNIVTSNADVTIYSDTDVDCPPEIDDLGSNTCGAAFLPNGGVVGDAVSINMDSPHIPTRAQRLRTITHEFGHIVGLHHTNDASAAQIGYTPVSDAASLMNGGECGRTNTISDFDRVALSQLYPNGEVSSGNSSDLDKYRSLYAFCLIDGKTPDDVVGFAMSNDGYTFVWYDDYTVSAGKSYFLFSYRNQYTYTLAPGKKPSDIVGMGISTSNYCYAWYKDGKVSAGKSSDLDSYRSLYSYSTAPGKTPNDIVGMAISTNNKCYAWYNDGTVSGGSSNDLDNYRSRYSYSLAPGKNTNDVVGMGIYTDNHCFVWYKQ